MTVERQQQVEQIFHAALERAPEERTTFLEQACNGDEALRNEVESLLAYDDPAGSFIETPPVSVAAAMLAERQEQLMVGRRLGHYQIISRLGAGGMGEVYLAEDTKLDRKVAIKVLPPDSVTDEKARRRLIREARAAAKLDHPGICAIHEVNEEDGQLFIVMQRVEGETLSNRILDDSFSLLESLDVAVQVANALVEAHSRGVIHRDLKPQNIMITAGGQVKVLDFGLAKVVEKRQALYSVAETESLSTQPGAIMGTVPYMSPEQVRGETLDARSDLFSFGVVLYEIVSRVHPFKAVSVASTLSAILTQKPALLARYSRDVPAELERIVSKAVQKEREERYQSAKDLLLDLKNLRDQLSFEARLRAISSESTEPASLGPAGETTVATASLPGDQTESLAAARTGPNTTSGVGGTKPLSWRAAMVAGVVIAAAAVVYFLFFAPSSRAVINSVAVLPFINGSDNADVEYLSDGMSDSLINKLSQLPNLSVKARSSVFRYKGKEFESQQVASELSVQAILNGRVVQRGDDLTVYLSLVDGRTGDQIWGEQYSRKLKDLLSLQGEIARDVSEKLRARLSGADERKLARDYTASSEAYQLYLRGRFHVLKLTPSEIDRGISYLQQAIGIDPNYALAYAGLADAYSAFALAAEMTPSEYLPKSKAAAEKAIEIDDTLSESHTTLGKTIFWYDWNWTAAELQYKRALELDPNNVSAHLFYAHLFSNTGRHEEALREVKRARELDPLSLSVGALEGQFLIYAGRTDEALARLQKTSEMDPNFWMPHLFTSIAYIEKRMYPAAVAEARRAMELSRAQTNSITLSAYALAKWGKRDEARAGLQELLDLSAGRFVPPCHIALVYNALGDLEETFSWLERGFQQRDPKMAFLKVDPKWSNLHDDPRFIELLRRMGFPM